MANARIHLRKYVKEDEARVWRKGRQCSGNRNKPSLFIELCSFFTQHAKSLKSPHFPSSPPAPWASLWNFWLQGEGVVNKRMGEGPEEIFSYLALDKANEDLLKHRKKPSSE